MEDVYSIFVEASKLSTPARSEWVNSLDLAPEARQELDELLSELDGYTPGRTKVRTLIVGTVEKSLPNPEQQLGRQLGPYRLERLVRDSDGRSAGNMGHVYEARRVDGAFDQTVAVKVIQRLRDDPGGRERFIRERRYLARLRHPNVVRIVDAGSLTADDGEEEPYFIMEWVEGGEDIASYCRRHELDIPARLRLFCEVCEGVAYAHSQGVVHRDLKPANVLVDALGVPRLLDFGISSQAEDEGDESLLRSTMTLAYASPEQLAKQPVGPPADIYSLGVMLYELLAGKRPYEVSGDWERDREFVETVVIPRLPGCFDLDHVLQKALAKRIEDRYQHADEFARDLRRFLSREPVAAAREHLGQIWGPTYFVWRYAQKFMRLLIAAALLVVLVLLGGAEFGRRQYIRLQERLQAGGLAAEAALAYERGEYALAAILGVESADRDPSFVARRILQQTVARLPRRIQLAPLDGVAHLAAFSPDRSTLLLVFDDSRVELRNPDDGSVRAALLPPEAIPASRGVTPCASITPDGRTLAVLVPGARAFLWDVPSRRLLASPVLPAAPAWQDFDCSRAGVADGLRYRSPEDWDVLLGASGAGFLHAAAHRPAATVTAALDCAPARRICLFATADSLELRRLGADANWQTITQKAGAGDGALSRDGQWFAWRRSEGTVHVERLNSDSTPVEWATFAAAAQGRHALRFQDSGARLLVEEGAEWRIYVPRLNMALVYRREPPTAAPPESFSFFTLEPQRESGLLVRTEGGADSYLVPAEGLITAWAADDISGAVAFTDREGRHLSLWRLPIWPGKATRDASVLLASNATGWAAAWTRGGALVAYSPIDGAVNHVLLPPPPPVLGAAPRVWSLRDSRYLLALHGREITLWDTARSEPSASAAISVNDPYLASDGSGWLSASSVSGGAILYSLPALKPVATVPGSLVLGIAAPAVDEVVLLAGQLGPDHSLDRRSLHLEFRSLPGFIVRRTVHLNYELEPGLQPALGTPCALLANESSGGLRFAFGRFRSGDLAGCSVLSVDTARQSATLEPAAPPAAADRRWVVRSSHTAVPGMRKLEIQNADDESVLASETLPDDVEGRWMLTPRGLGIQKDGAWREVLFEYKALRQQVCSSLATELSPEQRRQYNLTRVTPCRENK